MARKVLIADDDTAALQLYKAFFSAKGYDVIAVPGGRQALEVLASDNEIGLLILDLAMPDVQGEDVMEAMLKNEDWRKIPIVVDTAMGEETGRPARVRQRFQGLQIVFKQRPT
jgi:CheY-like chemotaxis protein